MSKNVLLMKIGRADHIRALFARNAAPARAPPGERGVSRKPDPASAPRDPKPTNIQSGCPDQPGFAPESLTTLAHFSVSSAISLPKSAGRPGSTAPPKSASRAFILGLARAPLISRLSLSMISAGVSFGAPTPYHAPAP